jgi:hypothetical protein
VTEFGTNIDPVRTVWVPPAPLSWVRYALRLDDGGLAIPYSETAWAAGKSQIGALDRLSFPWGWDRNSVRDAVTQYYQDYYITAFQVGNEPDLESPSSWTMAPEEWNELCWAVREVVNDFGRPDILVIGGGLASGHPEYLDGLDLSCLDAIAVHPYGRAPSGYHGPGAGFGSLSDLLWSYSSQYGPPVWVTEFGARSDEIGFMNQATYLRLMAKDLARNEVPVACQFCVDDSMVFGYGMFTGGEMKVAAKSYIQAAGRYGG